MVVYSKPSDSHKPFRHNMHTEPPEELNPFHVYWFFFGFVAVVFSNEFDMCIRNIQYALVCNGNPVRVLPKVLHYMPGTGHGCFAVDNPFGFIGLFHMLLKSTRHIHFIQFPFDAVQELAFECAAQLVYRVQVVVVLADMFPSTLEGIPYSRNNAMDVWMQ